METKKTLDKRVVAVIVGLVLVIAVLCGVVCYVLFLRPDSAAVDDGGATRIGYSSEASVMLDQDSLQAAVDEALENAKNSKVALRYKNNAYSTDGKTFACHIVNDPANLYDMFLMIYTDSGMIDQVYTSGLVAPGSGFEEITLDKALDPGDHTVYVAVTQVADDEETGEQVIRNQVVHTMEFYVTQ